MVKVDSTEVVKLLGVYIDSKLSFNAHVKDFCKKANQKIKARLRIRNYMSQGKADLLINAFVMSSFAYCPLIWIFCGKQGQDLLKRSHRRALCAKLNIFNCHYGRGLYIATWFIS